VVGERPRLAGAGGDDLTGTSYTHAEAAAGTTYFYSMRALNAAGAASGWLTDYPTAVAVAATGSGTATPTPGPTPTVATTQRSALVALYEATDGDNWYRNDNWLSDALIGTWYGVTSRYGTDIVDALRLWGNNLRGTLPDLSALSGLEVLTLGNNQLRGPIPDLGA